MDTKALRQKILDLAIRGKLVPQDPNDEPASVLLERIRAEKEQMVKDGKLKAKDIKNDSVIFLGDDNLHYEKFPDGTVKCIEDEIPFELPEGWECDRLSNIASFSGGKTPSTSKDEYWGNDYLWITSKDMKSKYLDSSQISLSEKGAEIMQIIPPDTLLLVARSGILRHTLPVAILKKQATINQDIKAISLYDVSLVEFIYSFLKGMESYILLRYTKSGTTVENINFDEFKNIIIPIPPKSEQIQIIDKINMLLSFVDTIESDKADLQTTIQLTKSKILDLAIKGQLVPQDPNDEPASVLLDRIRAEKEELIKQGKIKRDKKESVIFRGDDNSYYETIGSETINIDDEIPFDLPDEWEWVRLGVLFSHNTGKALNKKDSTGIKMTYITTSNLYWNRFELDSLKEMNFNESEIENCTVQKGDLLVCEGGDIGRASIWNYDNKIRIQNHIHKLRPYSEVSVLLYYYVFYYYKLTDRINGKGIGIQGLSSNQLHNIFLPLPPLNEQKRIADKVSQLFSLLDSIEENVN